MDKECASCSALKWMRKIPGLCCSNGKVQVLLLQAPPQPLSTSCFLLKQPIQNTFSPTFEHITLNFKRDRLDARGLTFNMAGFQRSPSRVKFITGSEVYVQSPTKMRALRNFTSWVKKRWKPNAKYFLIWSSTSSMTYRRCCTTAMSTKTASRWP